jgi:hypothetical protein
MFIDPQNHSGAGEAGDQLGSRPAQCGEDCTSISITRFIRSAQS